MTSERNVSTEFAARAVRAGSVPGTTIKGLAVPTTGFVGSTAAFVPVVDPHHRVLDPAAIRRELPAVPTRVRWYLRVTTFDRNSPKELATTRLNAAGLRAAERALLAQSPGGSSHLGPALRTVEGTGFAGRRLLIVLSDLELFDPDVDQVLDELHTSSADAVLALIFRSPPPAAIAGTRVQIMRVDPETSTPADIARRVVEGACAIADEPAKPTGKVDVLIDVLDDESGSMRSGNDAFFLRHEAALIAVEHLAARRPVHAPHGRRSS